MTILISYFFNFYKVKKIIKIQQKKGFEPKNLKRLLKFNYGSKIGGRLWSSIQQKN